MASQPLSELKLQATSAAQDAGFVALFDLCETLRETGFDQKSVVIGHMIGLHVERWGPPVRLMNKQKL